MPASLSLDLRVRPGSEQVSCHLDGETVILGLADGVYYGLDPVGARIWEELGGERTLAEIHELLLEEYEVEPGRCERDLLGLISDLLERRLVEVVSEDRVP